jgi:hypothetical protein
MQHDPAAASTPAGRETARAAPGAGETRPASAGAEPMRKERIVKEDGRFLYYYWFGDRARAAAAD